MGDTPLGTAQVPIRAPLDGLEADLGAAKSKIEGAIAKLKAQWTTGFNASELGRGFLEVGDKVN